MAHPPQPSGEEHARRWSAAHGGVPASRVVRWWLAGVRRVAAPLARAGVSPSAVTVAGLVTTLLAVLPAVPGGRWALAAAVLLVLGALADALDGAVAVLADRQTRTGAVLDAVCDRVADAAAVTVLWLLGAPGWLVLVAVGGGQLHEYLRARAQAEGMRGPGAVTVSERPTRVAVAAMFALAAGVYPGAGPEWAGAGAALAAALALIGLGVEGRAVRRALPRG